MRERLFDMLAQLGFLKILRIVATGFEYVFLRFVTNGCIFTVIQNSEIYVQLPECLICT
jgi:predicted ABC-type sugar transport system permease subunit